jgi:cell division protein FtsA
MYSTCIGLILKGYNDYENKNKQLDHNYIKANAAGILQQEPVHEEVAEEATGAAPVKIKSRKTLKGFMDTFKNNLIEMFKEEEDTHL